MVPSFLIRLIPEHFTIFSDLNFPINLYRYHRQTFMNSFISLPSIYPPSTITPWGEKQNKQTKNQSYRIVSILDIRKSVRLKKSITPKNMLNCIKTRLARSFSRQGSEATWWGHNSHHYKKFYCLIIFFFTLSSIQPLTLLL